MLLFKDHKYKSWLDYFEKLLTENGQFKLIHTNKNNQTLVQTYSQIIGNPQTVIEVGYLDHDKLIFLHIFNPDTPGNNRRQKLEHFYRDDFSEDDMYGPPGLVFTQNNLVGIYEQLTNGLNGKEIQYYLNNKLIKSEILIRLNNGKQDPISFPIHFNNSNLMSRLKRKVFGIKDEYTKREVNFNEIFNGLR